MFFDSLNTYMSSSAHPIWIRHGQIITPVNIHLFNIFLSYWHCIDDIGATQAPQVTVSPSAVEVLPGENIWLKCAPSGHPAPQLTWEFEHGVLPHNTQLVRTKLIIQHDNT